LAKRASVTSVEQSPEEERRSRFISYTIAMTIRVACVILAVVVDGWPRWIFIAGAVLLPYFAVVIANSTGSGKPVAGAEPVVLAPLRIEAKDFDVK
jgi:hypothetical protein